MQNLKCKATDCVHNNQEACTADHINIEGNTNCRTFCDEKTGKGCDCK